MREGWPRATVGDLFDVQLGKMLSPKAKTGADPKPYLGNAHVQWGRFVLHDLPRMDFSAEEQAKFSLRRGDLLMCEGGEIGRCAIWEGALNGCFYQKAVHRLRPRNGQMDTRFAAHCFEHNFRRTQSFAGDSGQTTIAHLPKERLERLEIPVPPLDEQRRMAAVLSAIDTARDRHGDVLARLQATKRTVASSLLSATNTTWVDRRIGDFAKRVRRMNVSGLDLPPFSVTKDRGVVLQSEKFHKRIATDPRKYLVAMPGEFVYDAMSLYYGAIGRVVQNSEGLVSPDYVLFEVDDSIDGEFFQHFVRSDTLHEMYETLAEGGNQHGKRRRIYWSVFESITVRVPPMLEQRRIAAVLSAIDDTVTRTVEEAARFGRAKVAIAQRLFSKGLA